MVKRFDEVLSTKSGKAKVNEIEKMFELYLLKSDFEISEEKTETKLEDYVEEFHKISDQMKTLDKKIIFEITEQVRKSTQQLSTKIEMMVKAIECQSGSVEGDVKRL